MGEGGVGIDLGRNTPGPLFPASSTGPSLHNCPPTSQRRHTVTTYHIRMHRTNTCATVGRGGGGQYTWGNRGQKRHPRRDTAGRHTPLSAPPSPTTTNIRPAQRHNTPPSIPSPPLPTSTYTPSTGALMPLVRTMHAARTPSAYASAGGPNSPPGVRAVSKVSGARKYLICHQGRGGSRHITLRGTPNARSETATHTTADVYMTGRGGRGSGTVHVQGAGKHEQRKYRGGIAPSSLGLQEIEGSNKGQVS
jgi:hypothetical protein